MAKFRCGAKRHKKRALLRCFLFFLVLLLLFSFVGNIYLRPKMLSIATAYIRNYMTELVRRAIFTVFEDHGYQYGDFIHLTQKEDGSLVHMGVDTFKLNMALYAISAEILHEIGEERCVPISLPLGTLFGSEWLGGRGPNITLRVLVEKGLKAGFRSEFCSQGINQTQHSVIFSLKMEGTILFASGSTVIDLSEDILAAQDIILGDVPGTYTSISRLTSDITEEEIDDIFDFGHTD